MSIWWTLRNIGMMPGGRQMQERVSLAQQHGRTATSPAIDHARIYVFPPSSEEDMLIRVNLGPHGIPAGRAVRAVANGVMLAHPNLGEDAFGVTRTQAGVGQHVEVMTGGAIHLPDWTESTGQATLTTGASYFLHDEGMLRVGSPDETRQIAQVIGTAISPHELLVEVDSFLVLNRP